MTQQNAHVGVAEKTPLSEKLHRQALAWFEDHPGDKGFLRRYVPGEFTPDAEADMKRNLGGDLVYVYVAAMGEHLAARVPVTATMYYILPAQFSNFIDLADYREHHCVREAAQERRPRHD